MQTNKSEYYTVAQRKSESEVSLDQDDEDDIFSLPRGGASCDRQKYCSQHLLICVLAVALAATLLAKNQQMYLCDAKRIDHALLQQPGCGVPQAKMTATRRRMKGRGRLTAMLPPAGLSALLLASVFWQSASKNDSDQEEDEGERKADRCAAAGQLDETFAQRGRHIQVHTVTQRERKIIRMETHHCYYIFVFLQPTEAWDFITLFVQYQLAV